MLQLVFLGFLASAGIQGAPSPLEGAWNLQEYVLDGKDVPVSGTLIFSGDRFAMAYRMGPAADSGRGHGGTYRVEGDRLLFLIPYWLQHVDGAPQVMTETPNAGSQFVIEGDELRIRFENDALQRFTRAPSSTNPLDGAWMMSAYESEAKSGNAEGHALFADGSFVLIYVMDRSSSAPDARVHAGGFGVEGDTLTLKVETSIHCVGGEGRVERTPSPRDTQFRLEDEKLDLAFASGARMSFVRVP
ncbi:MAG TPA: hypothetical protein VJ921_09415 [Vicinamibacteria bacterium]|nr:hypothetical protein [Vicinamibacteria bacterium]